MQEQNSVSTGTRNKSGAKAQRTAKGEKRIAELLSVAGELFLERGFEAVAVDDLIARAGGSRRNVYSHFGGKEGLFIAAMTQICDEVAEPFEGLIIDERDTVQALTSTGRQLLRAILTPRTLSLHRLMVTEGIRFPDMAQAIFNAGPQKVVDTLAAWIENARREPETIIASDLCAAELAELFVNLVLGHVQLRVLVGIEPLPIAESEVIRIVNNAVDVFLHGVSSGKTECTL